jgi:CheY-like chemotaxis protein
LLPVDSEIGYRNLNSPAPERGNIRCGILLGKPLCSLVSNWAGNPVNTVLFVYECCGENGYVPPAPQGMAVRILIADDDTAIRGLLRRLIENHEDWSVCADAVTGEDAVDKASELNPDLIVLDLAMPQMNGLQAAREISRTTPKTPMLLLTVQEVSRELTREARHAGFKGAVSKSTGSEVIRAIELLLENQLFFQTVPQDAFVL